MNSLSRYPKKVGSKGSLRAIQVLVNKHPDLFLRELKLKLPEIESICWVSPIEKDDYAEYRDDAILERLQISHLLQTPLNEFWPKKGPRWDALGLLNHQIPLIVEAKAHLQELKSSQSKAVSPQSIAKIHKSLSEVKHYFNCPEEVNWSGMYYQYTNRLAHLYYLTELNGIPAYLLNVLLVIIVLVVQKQKSSGRNLFRL